MGTEPLDPHSLGISQGLYLMLDNIRREWAGSSTEKIDELLTYVYATAPMLAVKDKHERSEKVLTKCGFKQEAFMKYYYYKNEMLIDGKLFAHVIEPD